MTTDQDRPRVLYLTHHLPWPPCSGGRLREAELLRRLTPHFDIELVAVSKTPGLDQSHANAAVDAGVQARIFPTVAFRSPALSPHVRRHQSPGARRYLERRLAPADGTLVHVEGHYLFGLLPTSAQARALIVEHNVESQLFEQQAWMNTDLRKRDDLLTDAELTRLTERNAWRGARLVAAVTEDDASVMRQVISDRPVPVIPGGADHLLASADWTRRRPPDAGQVVFVANFAYPPNLDAAQTIIADILPGIRSRCPEVTLALVGPSPPRWLVDTAQADPQLTVTGWVPDVAEYLDAADIVLCPLRIGGGVKIKVLEAVARGRAVVTTPVGMQGLHHLPPGATLECTGIDSIIDCCVRLLRSPDERKRQESRASSAARHLPTWDQSAAILASTWLTLPSENVPAALIES